VWVLSSAYRFSRPEIAAALSGLLRARAVVFSSSDRLTRALEAYTKGQGDFADYLIREHARSAGAETVATFDRSLLKERGFSKP
jgi:predicted nucleic-acid-binding protein